MAGNGPSPVPLGAIGSTHQALHQRLAFVGLQSCPIDQLRLCMRDRANADGEDEEVNNKGVQGHDQLEYTDGGAAPGLLQAHSPAGDFHS